MIKPLVKSPLIFIKSPEAALIHELNLMNSVITGEVDHALSIWTTSQSIVVPKRLLRLKNFHQAANILLSRGWPVFVRNTGGDATPQGPGIINVTYAYVCKDHKIPNVKETYQELCKPIINFVEKMGYNAETQSIAGAFCDGEYNVTVNDKKLAGTAQRRSRRQCKDNLPVLFAHALILVDANITTNIAAINAFYQLCEERKKIDTNAHLNLSNLIEFPQQQATVSFSKVVARTLSKDYKKLLQSKYKQQNTFYEFMPNAEG